MAFQNDTNTGRVKKMVDTLRLIVKSATSNSADTDALADMLRPLTDELAGLGVLPPAGQMTESQPPKVAAQAAGQRAALILADQASLRELMASLIGRLDAHAHRLEETP
ncbi:hypothetical protein [uncultured Ruegeria sp.]|uniref:hypothetical protein n=1 Tax=uncultured Ruegeria sp. TaxID=259304 RepID=UPI0026052EB2|nr:hypothetical protein [uncultured Ruegeria sp.]